MSYPGRSSELYKYRFENLRWTFTAVKGCEFISLSARTLPPDLLMFIRKLRLPIRDVTFVAGFILRIRVRWPEHVARMGERRRAYRGLMGKYEGKR